MRRVGADPIRRTVKHGDGFGEIARPHRNAPPAETHLALRIDVCRNSRKEPVGPGYVATGGKRHHGTAAETIPVVWLKSERTIHHCERFGIAPAIAIGVGAVTQHVITARVEYGGVPKAF